MAGPSRPRSRRDCRHIRQSKGDELVSPSYSPRTKLMYVSTWEFNAHIFGAILIVYEPGRGFGGGVNQTFVPTPGEPTRNISGAPGLPNLRRGPLNNWTDAAGNGSIQAIDPVTGDAKWKFRLFDVIDTGIFTTASDLLIKAAARDICRPSTRATAPCCGRPTSARRC